MVAPLFLMCHQFGIEVLKLTFGCLFISDVHDCDVCFKDEQKSLWKEIGNCLWYTSFDDVLDGVSKIFLINFQIK